MITLEQVKDAVNPTWFNFEDHESGSIVMDSREYGDVGQEQYGEADWKEGLRIKEVLEKAFPEHFVTIDTCDEWVCVDIGKEDL